MYNLDESMRGGTCCLSKAGLAVGGTASIMRLNDPTGAGYVSFAINGYIYTIVDADDNVAFTAATQAALTTCLYTVCIAYDGTITVVKGDEVVTANLTAGTHVLNWPMATADTCPLGGVRVVATAVFTPGTTDLGTGNAATYYDFYTVPTEPMTS